jgi:NAD(P)-dependent dehydrogenase (short-subunit alcohol dehydrogenase family)
VAIAADAADAEAVRAAVNGTVEAFGRLDILVNNAGGGSFGPVEQLTVDDFDRSVAVNMRSVFVATQEALRHMGDGGRIISIVPACRGQLTGLIVYLAGPESGFVTGATINIDGGYTV